MKPTIVQITPTHEHPYVYEEPHAPRAAPVSLQYRFVVPDAPTSVLHYHDVLELGVCHEGSGVFVVDRKTMHFSAGDVSVIVPGEPHLARSRRGTHARWSFVFIDTRAVLGAKFAEIEHVGFDPFYGAEFNNIWTGRQSERVVEIVHEMVGEVRRDGPFALTMATCRLAELYAVLSEVAPKPVSETPRVAVRHVDIERIQPALAFVLHNYWRSIHLPEAARLCNMSDRNFSRVFRDRMGESYVSYVNRTRIAFACDQLIGTAMPVSAIADATGFKTISSFNREFRRVMQTTPRSWRAANR